MRSPDVCSCRYAMGLEASPEDFLVSAAFNLASISQGHILSVRFCRTRSSFAWSTWREGVTQNVDNVARAVSLNLPRAILGSSTRVPVSLPSSRALKVRGTSTCQKIRLTNFLSLHGSEGSAQSIC